MTNLIEQMQQLGLDPDDYGTEREAREAIRDAARNAWPQTKIDWHAAHKTSPWSDDAR